MVEETPVPTGLGLPGVGTAETASGVRGGYVCLEFRTPVQWLALDPQTALALAESMAKDAYILQHGTVPPAHALKDHVIERKRQVLVTRCEIIIRQLSERKRSTKHIAERVVDAALNELV